MMDAQSDSGPSAGRPWSYGSHGGWPPSGVNKSLGTSLETDLKNKTKLSNQQQQACARSAHAQISSTEEGGDRTACHLEVRESLSCLGADDWQPVAFALMRSLVHRRSLARFVRRLDASIACGLRRVNRRLGRWSRVRRPTPHRDVPRRGCRPSDRPYPQQPCPSWNSALPLSKPLDNPPGIHRRRACPQLA